MMENHGKTIGKPLFLQYLTNVGRPIDSVQMAYKYDFTFGFLAVITIVRWGFQQTYN